MPVYISADDRGQCPAPCSITLSLIPLRPDLSLNLKLGLLPAISRLPVVCPPPVALQLKGCSPCLAFHVGTGDLNPDLPRSCSYPLSLFWATSPYFKKKKKKNTWNSPMLQTQKFDSDHFTLFLPQIWLLESPQPGLSWTNSGRQGVKYLNILNNEHIMETWENHSELYYSMLVTRSESY